MNILQGWAVSGPSLQKGNFQVNMCGKQFCFFLLLQNCTIVWNTLPILKESGPPEVLLTHMAKKSRSAQAVSIFYDSSWVLPRGCPCHSHLKNRSTETTLLNINRHRDVRKQDEAVRQTVEPADNTRSHTSLVACWETVSESVKLLLSESETHMSLDDFSSIVAAFFLFCYVGYLLKIRCK